MNDGAVEQEWFYRGSAVNKDKFEMLISRENLVADLSFE